MGVGVEFLLRDFYCLELFLILCLGVDKVVDRCKFCREILKVSSK